MRTMKLVAMAASVLLAGLASTALASSSLPIKGSEQGGSQGEEIDLDSDSCFPLGPGGPIICVDFSASDTGVSGRQTIGPSARVDTFLVSGVSEGTAVPGTGCSADPTGIKACTLNGHTDGCLFTSEGGYGVNSYPDGSLLISQISPGGSLCIDLNSPSFAKPWPYTFMSNFTYTGGTGRYAGATGGGKGTGVGAILVQDAAGHSFGWFSETFNATINLP